MNQEERDWLEWSKRAQQVKAGMRGRSLRVHDTRDRITVNLPVPSATISVCWHSTFQGYATVTVTNRLGSATATVGP
jgi:hypothetical protein